MQIYYTMLIKYLKKKNKCEIPESKKKTDYAGNGKNIKVSKYSLAMRII